MCIVKVSIFLAGMECYLWRTIASHVPCIVASSQVSTHAYDILEYLYIYGLGHDQKMTVGTYQMCRIYIILTNIVKY